MAKKYICEILGEYPKDIAEAPSVEYREEGDASFGDPRGKWTVRWPRALGSYLYHRDELAVIFVEKYGITHFVDKRVSEICPTDVRIDRVRAEKLAYEGGVTAMKKFGDMYPSGDPGKAVKAELLIVNPNGLLTDEVQTLWDLGKAPSLKARLAWVVDFKGFTHPYEVDKQDEPVKTAQIWIDAATGEVVGGTLYLHALRK